MPEESVSWGVVSTMREPLDQTLAFVAHHLALGAKEVHIFLDDHRDPAFKILNKIPGCFVTRCGQPYWKRVMKMERPVLQTGRQVANATRTYQTCGVDWLLHADADEFLFFARPLAEELARLDPSATWLRIPNVERCWLEGEARDSVFSGVFRHTIRPDHGHTKRVYGAENMDYMFKGQLGSSVGKALIRTGHDFTVSIHAPREKGFGTDWPPHDWAHGVFLLHFDGLTPLHWAAKTLRYAEHTDAKLEQLLHPQRKNQVVHVRDTCADLHEVLAFYDRLSVLSAEQAADLTRIGMLSRCDIDPEAALHALLPDHTPDFSARSFDVGLGMENASRLMRKIKGETEPS